MSKPTLNDIVDSYKTNCCNSAAERRVNKYFCKICKSNVTQEFYIIVKSKVD